MPDEPSGPSPTNCGILFRGAGLLVVNKPAGVLSHPNTPDAGAPCAFLGNYDRKTRCFSGPAGPVHLIHRIDQDTSGILMGATSPEVASAMRDLFETRAVRKHYITLVSGNPPPEGRWVDHLLTRHAGDRLRTVVKRGAKPNALAIYRVTTQGKGRAWSLLEVELVSGKTHQIRVQAASRHHFVAGDDVYGRFDWNKSLRQSAGLTRLFLHASLIAFTHPVTGRPVHVTCPLPPDLAGPLARLES